MQLYGLGRATSFVVLLATSALGSGLALHLHNSSHAAEDAARVEARAKEGLPPEPLPEHDENNCEIHAQLALPLFSHGHVALLWMVGPHVGSLTALPRMVLLSGVRDRIRCRGPPVPESLPHFGCVEKRPTR